MRMLKDFISTLEIEIVKAFKKYKVVKLFETQASSSYKLGL